MLVKKQLFDDKILIFKGVGLKYCKLINIEIKKILKENNISAISIEDQKFEITNVSMILRSNLEVFILINSHIDESIIKIYKSGIKVIIINPHEEVMSLLLDNNLINLVKYVTFIKMKIEDF